MIKKNAYSWIYLFVLFIPLSLLWSGCSVKKKNFVAAYLDSTKTLSIDKYPFPYKEPTIQQNEFVEVRFAGLNPNVSTTLNNYGGASQETKINDASGTFSGQQVDLDGNLNFPIIGKVKAVGLTTAGLRTELLKRVDSILLDPYIYVGLPRRGVTFMGEVKSSGPIVFSKERANILEFLARAGSVTDFADITKIKVYRENADGQRQMGNVNLNDTALFQSPFFYPVPNDVVYVPGSKKKALQSGTTYFPYISIIVSVVSIALAYILRR